MAFWGGALSGVEHLDPSVLQVDAVSANQDCRHSVLGSFDCGRTGRCRGMPRCLALLSPGCCPNPPARSWGAGRPGPSGDAGG